MTVTLATGERALTDAAAAISTAPADIDSADRPDIPHEGYARTVARAKKCRALLIGTEAIRDGRMEYLSPLENESTGSYEFRRTLCALHNGFARTLDASVGFLLEEPPTLGEDMPAPLVKFAENVNRRGDHLNVFARKLAKHGMCDGYAGIMVEHTHVADPLNTSRDDEERDGVGPYWLTYKVDDVIREEYQSINGVQTLVLLVLREIVKRKNGKFGRKRVTQYRVYEKTNTGVTWELWEVKGAEVVPTVKPTEITNQTEIPWSPLPLGEETGPGEYKPPLLDLADLNLEHHQCKTNIRSLEMLACVPTIVRIGVDKDPNGEFPPLTVGSRAVVDIGANPNVTTPLYYLTADVSVLEPGQKSLDKIEAAMGAAGMAFLSPQTRVAETAEARRIDTAAQRASLATVAQTLQDCLERAFHYTANYLLLEAGSVTLNADYSGERIDPQYLAVLVTAYQQGVLGIEELRHVIQTGELPEEFDSTDVVDLIARQRAKDDQNRLEAGLRADENANHTAA